MGLRLSGSKLGLARKCGFPFRADVEVAPEPKIGRPAHTGVGFALLREYLVEDGRFTGRPDISKQAKQDIFHVGAKPRAERLIDRWLVWWESYLAKHPGLHWESEIPFAFDPSTGRARRLPVSSHRAYEGAKPHEIVGTVDMVGTSEREIIILDEKTGRRDNVAPARENAQLGFLSMCHSVVSKVRTGRVGLVFPHLEEPLDEVLIDGISIDAAKSEFMALPGKIATSGPTIGDWCRLCPHRAACPAWKSTDAVFSSKPVRAVSSREMRTRIKPGKVPDEVVGSGGDVQAGTARPQTSEDNDFAPKRGTTPRRAAVLSDDFQRIVEKVYKVDVLAEYDRLEKALRVGESRTDRAILVRALDEAESNAWRAHALYLSAIAERTRWEADAEMVSGPARSNAVAELSAEKRHGVRKKDITDADVRAKLASMHPDEFKWQEKESAKIRGMEKQLGKLADLWSSRCATLRIMVDKAR